MQREITERQNLLTREGFLTSDGWSRKPYFNYNKENIKASKFKIKEWDYYAITNQKKGYTISVTLSDLGYSTLASIAYIDYNLKAYSQTDVVKLLPLKHIRLAHSSTEDSYVSTNNPKLRVSYIKKGNKRRLLFCAPNLVLPDNSIGLNIDAELLQPNEMESINIATSWENNRKAFYLNEKINCMRVSGTIKRGYDIETIDSNTTFATLDWGRGRWTYVNTWYWSSLSTVIDNKKLGFNLGYGFSDRTNATENAIFYEDRIHKLNKVSFTIPDKFLEKPWIIKDNEKRLDLIFFPLVDRIGKFDYKIIKSDQHQVFGKFSGKLVLDNKEIIIIKDQLGFAEKVYNKW